jgi:hypothetical protein
MSATTAVRYDEQDGDLVIRVPLDSISRENVSRFLDYLLVESVSRKFEMSDDEIAVFAEEVDKAAWERLRPMVEEKLRGR